LVTHGGAGKYGPLATSFLEDYGKLVTEDVFFFFFFSILIFLFCSRKLNNGESQ